LEVRTKEKRSSDLLLYRQAPPSLANSYQVTGLGFWFLGRPPMPVASKEERAGEPARPVVVDRDWRGGK